MGTFRLEPLPSPEAARRATGWEGLSRTVLLQDARWFTNIRWAVVAVFAGFGAVARLAPQALAAVGLQAPAVWPWALAAVVALVNVAIVGWLRRISSRASRQRVKPCIWVQIVADLLALTVLVYLVGPVDTVIPFAYLFHIALACIFFGSRESAVVVLLSAGLYLAVVALEVAGALPARSILAHAQAAGPPDAHALVITALPTVFIWFVVWYLVSTIAAAVRLRDRDLENANERLLRADQEKNLQVLRVTHDLKAPFVGIESNIQVLRSTYWDALPEEVRDLIGKIDARGATLRARIGDILTLGNLRSDAEAVPAFADVALKPLLAGTVEDVGALAARRRVAISPATADATVRSDARQLRLLFLNLLTNAVSYSAEGGGAVEVKIDPGDPVRVRVTDHGIGISDKALPHIFEDYYRSPEAGRINTQSTGLGLAIVRQAARNLGLTIDVDSTEGEGTTVEVVFPPERREHHGHDQDH